MVIVGLCTLPSESAMMADIAKKRERVASSYYSSKRHTIQASCEEYRYPLK